MKPEEPENADWVLFLQVEPTGCLGLKGNVLDTQRTIATAGHLPLHFVTQAGPEQSEAQGASSEIAPLFGVAAPGKTTLIFCI
jgi:hypothetical protein